MKLSIIVPAHNEEKLLPDTLAAIGHALSLVESGEMIVVDNVSEDRTPEIARSAGATVITETVRNIAAVRNAGARAAAGDILVFIDADTIVPEQFFKRIHDAMRDTKCFGGSVRVSYGQFERWWMKYYSMGWKFWGKLFNMKQGAAQFCRKEVFGTINGFDESIFMGEDIEFYWRLTRHAKTNGGYLHFIKDIEVVTSSRRFDKMSIWKTLLLTHPFFIMLNRKRGESWKDWYQRPPR